MKNNTVYINALLSLFILIYSNHLPGQTNLISDPAQVVIHTEDIHLFWKVYDETKPKFSARKFDEEYLEKGSDGLKGFIRMRIQSGKHLKKTIKKNIYYYENIRQASQSIDGNKPVLMGYFKKLKSIYPDAVFPEIYFVIGALNTGGTTFSGGLIIGAEMFGDAKDNFNPRLPREAMDLIVVHELIHYQQNYVHDQSLLAQTIREGTADFVCELLTGSHSNEDMYQYGQAHEAELWNEFKQQMDGNSWSPWLYGNKDNSRPKDLGYWMGYKIAQAYYLQMPDKNQAVNDLLNIQDFKKLLTQSGYNGNN
ncbi:MAG TPA: DUF2268 domain-containing putative Zn-dependent protease [Saprospiraceae bacterium]|nr:DUF2268 domain-containing putative Zn-dependent protease [Saprospiraceae bacterium]